MKAIQYYFENEDAETCHTLDYFIESADPEATEIHLMKAVRDKGTTDFIWCKEFQTCVERGECGKICSEYKPRNGKSGICSHQGNLYLHDEWVTINLPGKGITEAGRK